jgi:hypothetical protein
MPTGDPLDSGAAGAVGQDEAMLGRVVANHVRSIAVPPGLAADGWRPRNRPAVRLASDRSARGGGQSPLATLAAAAVVVLAAGAVWLGVQGDRRAASHSAPPASAAARVDASSPPASSSGSPAASAVAWVDATPGPSSPATVPPGTPACSAAIVSLEAGWQGATGSMAGSVWATNTGPSVCALAGPPQRVELRAGGSLSSVAFTATSVADSEGAAPAPPVLLAPGGRAFAELVWTNWCGKLRPSVTAVRVTLPDGSGPVDAARMEPGFAGVPRCDVPNKSSTLTAYAFQPEEPATRAAQAPVRVTIAAPATAQAGADLGYTVTITNPGSTQAALDPCPAYDESIVAGGVGLKGSDRRLVINCVGLSGPIAPGASVTLAIRIPVPSDAPAGPAELHWSLEADGPLAQDPATALAAITIAGAAAPKVVCDRSAPASAGTDDAGSPIPVMLTCANAVTAAEAALGPDLAIASIEFDYFFWCPPGYFCVASTLNDGHVIFHMNGERPDMVVDVVADAAGSVTASKPQPVPSPNAVASAQAGP